MINLSDIGIKIDSIIEITKFGDTITAMKNNKKVLIKNIKGKFVLVN